MDEDISQTLDYIPKKTEPEWFLLIINSKICPYCNSPETIKTFRKISLMAETLNLRYEELWYLNMKQLPQCIKWVPWISLVRNQDWIDNNLTLDSFKSIFRSKIEDGELKYAFKDKAITLQEVMDWLEKEFELTDFQKGILTGFRSAFSESESKDLTNKESVRMELNVLDELIGKLLRSHDIKINGKTLSDLVESAKITFEIFTNVGEHLNRIKLLLQ